MYFYQESNQILVYPLVLKNGLIDKKKSRLIKFYVLRVYTLIEEKISTMRSFINLHQL